jgi:hypothetical protein
MNPEPFAARPVPGPSAPSAPRGRLWLRVLVVATLLALGLLGALFALWTSVEHWQGLPLHVIVDGEEVYSGFQWSSLDPGQQLAVAASVLLGLLAISVLLPLAILAVLALALLAVLTAVGLPMLAALLVFGVLLAPLLLLGWAAWRLLRALFANDRQPTSNPASRA